MLKFSYLQRQGIIIIKHILEGQYDFDIRFEDLVEFSKTEYYNAQTNPISIKNLQAFNKSKRAVQPSEPRTDRFKKLKLPNGKIVRYYEALTKFPPKLSICKDGACPNGRGWGSSVLVS